MSPRTPARLAAAGLPLLAALALAACGDLESGGEGGDTSRGELTENTTSEEQAATTPARDLPPRPDGVVEVEGDISGSVAEEVDARFDSFRNRSGLAIEAVTTDTDENTGFSDLCEGEIDIVSASRRITEAELEACEENGLQVIDFQVAFDALVVATRNERDVGADCVNLAQLRAMFGAGTPVTSWNQLNPNFFPLRLTTAGPTPDNSDFDFFGARVLGVPDPTLANFRSDYNAFPREQQVKNFVAGRIGGDAFRQAGREARQIGREVEKSQRRLRVANRELRESSAELNAAGRRLDRAVEREDADLQEIREREFRQAKKRQKRAEKNQRKASRNLKRLSDLNDRANNERRRLDRLVPPGAVGIVGFSYYELFEEKLRPLEIDGQTGDRCVFPSEETIASELYPLERTLRLYTTQRSLRRAEVQSYIQFHLEQAEEIANRLELIAVPDQLRQEEIAKITDPNAAEETEAASQSQGGATTGEQTTTEQTTTEGEDTGGESTTTDATTTETTTTTTTTEGG